MTHLKCDYDRVRLPRIERRIATLCAAHRLTVECISIRKTRRGWHVTIEVRQRLAFWRVVLLQALLGSDWKRELFNSCRAVAWRRVPRFWRDRANVLYVRHHRRVEL